MNTQRSSGDIKIEGTNIDDINIVQQKYVLGKCPYDPIPIPGLTVDQCLGMMASIRGLS